MADSTTTEVLWGIRWTDLPGQPIDIIPEDMARLWAKQQPHRAELIRRDITTTTLTVAKSG